MKLRVGIDVGGTFTDVTAFDEDQGELVAVRKYLSNPLQPVAVIDTITQDLAGQFGAHSVGLVLHGSTVALNTLLEGAGVRVGLLTTRGFRDLYEIGRQWRGEEVFNLFAPAPKMLLTRDRILEIRERVDFQGGVVEPLEAEDVAEATRRLTATGVDAIAVCFLFAYANPSHERAAAEIIRATAPDLYVSLSHEVDPQWREYERTASTVANAYIGPPVVRHLQTLEDLSHRRFPRSQALVMKSDGGAASAAMLASAPIQTVMSGPVAGVIAGRHLGDLTGIEKLITFDVGGTSCDMAVLPGRPVFKSELVVARHPVRVHSIDINTIGAGGGSIASVEFGGVLKVGPRSAGADPGPACYGRGGNNPTLTDALVLLGHLNPTALLAGEMPIMFGRAEETVLARIAKPLGLVPIQAAQGIVRVLASNVAAAMRTITVERGYDPREFTLIPFGGMGPTIAGLIAAELGIRRLLVPRDPGTFSAHGMLVCDVHQERTLTRVVAIDQTSAAELEGIFSSLEVQALNDLRRERFPEERLQSHRHAGMRYRGQSYEVLIPVPRLGCSEDMLDLVQRFHEAHKLRYGHMAQSESIEIVNFHVTAVGIIPKPVVQSFEGEGGESAQHGARKAYFKEAEATAVPVFHRADLRCGARIEGPAIIDEKTSTTVLYPGHRAQVDRYLNIAVELS